ncbi:MAG: hypothetical protein AAF557_04190 [Pseudomonadota bacterium]
MTNVPPPMSELLWRRPVLMPLWQAIPKALAGGQVAFIHTRRATRRLIRAGQLPFYNRLCPLLADMGYAVAVMPFYRPPYLRWVNKKCLHIYRGPGRPRREPGVLHVAKGYIDGYWYVDPMGHREDSGIGAKTFDAKAQDPEISNQFFKQIRRQNVHKGHSQREQTARGGADVIEGAIAIMLQRMVPGEAPKDAICTEAEMIRAIVAVRGDRPVMIKFHPFGATDDVKTAVAEAVNPAEGVHLVDANVHDILDAAAMVCTQTSGVGFEAFLHRTPTLLFAGADYHHAAIPVGSLDELPDLIARAADQKFPYPKYVHWFLEQNLFRPNAEDFHDRIRPIIEAAAE